ncbi:MAG: CDP-diacylglycerol--serine O-phosphatidyltransferase [Gemmatimonadota bacterium]|nr:CDP-diacylglycerol--serine O-phosphatidyltransferase [Gemmatimonadota bacterium]
MKTKRRPRVQRVVVVVPSLFTLANLFFGFWSMILASQGEWYRASWWIVIAGILDTLDGMSARVSGTGSKFGAELDSLVDLVSFGIAPGILIYFQVLQAQGGFGWVFSYAFAVCVALRLARFNSQPATAPAGKFTGLPSTAAGMTLAAYYPFSQTDFFQNNLQNLGSSQFMIILIVALGAAMVSNAEYAKLPRAGFRTTKGLMGLAVQLTLLWFLLFNRDIFFFPLGIAYVGYGLLRSTALAFTDRGDDNGIERHEEPNLKVHPSHGDVSERRRQSEGN